VAERAKRPQSITEALTRPAVDLVDVAHITGFSYGTLITDARLGEIKTLKRRKGTRTRYVVTKPALVAYLRQLGCTISTTTTTT
jgi:hypothetical protein